jgi:hypothetical protein
MCDDVYASTAFTNTRTAAAIVSLVLGPSLSTNLSSSNKMDGPRVDWLCTRTERKKRSCDIVYVYARAHTVSQLSEGCLLDWRSYQKTYTNVNANQHQNEPKKNVSAQKNELSDTHNRGITLSTIRLMNEVKWRSGIGSLTSIRRTFVGELSDVQMISFFWPQAVFLTCSKVSFLGFNFGFY